MVCVTVNDATNNVQLTEVDFYYSQNGGIETSVLADGKLCLEDILSGTTLEFRAGKVGYETGTEIRIINGDVLDWFLILNPVSSLLFYVCACVFHINYDLSFDVCSVSMVLYMVLPVRKKNA